MKHTPSKFRSITRLLEKPGPAPRLVFALLSVAALLIAVQAKPSHAGNEKSFFNYFSSGQFINRGWVETTGARDVKNSNSTDAKGLLRGRLHLENRGRYRLNQETRMKSVISLEADYLYQGGGQDDSYHDFKTDLYEAYFQLSHKNLTLTAGRQLVRWGKTDQVSPCDNINPQDLRLFILTEMEERKRPDWMLRLQKFFPAWSWEGIYIPWFLGDEVDYLDSDWAIFRHLRADIRESSLPDPLKAYAERVLRVQRHRPSHTLGNGEFGTRLNTTIGQVDLSLSYLYGWENQPTITSFPIKNLDIDGRIKAGELTDLTTNHNLILTDGKIQATWKRQQVVGLEFETTAGMFGLRGEAAHFNHMTFLCRDLTSRRLPVFHAILGSDYTSNSNGYLNLQFSWMKILNYNSDLLYFERNTLTLMGELSQEFQNNNLLLRLRYSYTMNNNSYYLEPSIILKYITNLEIKFGANLLGGKTDTLFGSFRDNNQIFCRIKYHF